MWLFIILVPLVYSFSENQKSPSYFTESPIGRTSDYPCLHSADPGPVAVADILKADLGWVIVVGFIVGIPTAIVSGPLLGNTLLSRFMWKPPERIDEEETRIKECCPMCLPSWPSLPCPFSLLYAIPC